MATATPMFTSEWVTMASGVKLAFTSGKRVRALAHAFTTRSLNDTFTFSPARSCSRTSTAWPMSMSTVT